MRTAVDYFPKVPIGDVVDGHIWTGVAWEREPMFRFPSAKTALVMLALTLAASGVAAVLANSASQSGAPPQATISAGAAPPPPDHRGDISSAESIKSAEREDAYVLNGTQYGGYPEKQKAFVFIVLDYREELAKTRDAQKERIMIRERDKELTEIIGEDLKVTDWVGTVVDKGITAEGRGYIMIEIAQELRVVTWSNAFSDLTSATLLLPGTKPFEEFEQVSIGDAVDFSGHFLEGEDTALDQGNWTEKNYGIKPEFLFHFEHVHQQPQLAVRRTIPGD